MATRPITLIAGYRRATVPRIAKLRHRACAEDDEDWWEPLTAIGYAESYGPLAPEDVPDTPEPKRAPIGFAY